MGRSTGAVLGRSLAGLRSLVDRELAEVRLGAGVEHRERVVVADFIGDVEVAATMDADSPGLHLSIASVARDVTVRTDRHVLTSVVTNLLQTAFKFTHAGGHIVLRARATSERVLIDIEDECGGLPPGKTEELFIPFDQRGADRTGLGLGLALCLRGAQANDGEIRVLNRPGKGCVFTLDLARESSSPVSAS